MLSVTVIAQMWIAVYQPEWGLLNTCLRFLGLSPLAKIWLVEDPLVIWSVTFAFLWQYIGLNMLIIYAGIKNIPHTYYEAAKLEGITFIKTSLHITIPLLQEILKFVMITSFLGCMSQFTYIKIMTQGGPGKISRTVIYNMYAVAFMNQEYGKGCAIAVLYIIQCLVITVIINKLLAKERIAFL